ncbi:YkgJ family cysteine cluster protein [Candidatus Woesearchaeota archaeon]|nr:YkgJ family cysteine cluster protein [Candidatus Woesearchaeota archaeon]
MSFQCKHCGQCCIDECTQINISIGDIVRICRFLKCNVGDILPKIGIKPFGDPETANQYDYELGLNIPCEFRQGEKCTIYPARPLNCRIFPYFFLGNFANDRLKEVIDPSHKCISEGIEFTDEEKEKYKKYSEFIGKLIMKEARLTDQFYEKYNLKQSKIMPAYVFPADDPNDMMYTKEITKSKIKMAMSIMNPAPYANLKNQLQNFIMLAENSVVSADEINLKEKELLS